MPQTASLAAIDRRIKDGSAAEGDFLTAIRMLAGNGRMFDAIVMADAGVQMYAGSPEIRSRLSDLLEPCSTAGDVDALIASLPRWRDDLRPAFWKLHGEFGRLHGPQADRPATESFLLAVVLKNLGNAVRNAPMVRRALLRLGDHFGRRSAVEAWSAPAASSVFDTMTATVEIGGQRIAYRRDNPDVDFHLFYMFVFEPGMLRWIAGFEPTDVFLDIGANIGKFSLIAARARGCRTIAVEPFPANLEALQANVALNGVGDRVSVHALAISDVTGGGVLDYEKSGAGATGSCVALTETGETRSDTVRLVRLDDLIEGGEIAFPNHIKIDVDGEEHRLIDGMTRCLADPRLKSLRIEIRLDTEENRAAMETLRAAGFDCKIDDDLKNYLCQRR